MSKKSVSNVFKINICESVEKGQYSVDLGWKWKSNESFVYTQMNQILPEPGWK